ncbi:hypothetical protein SAMN06265784_108123 [Paraburkholderia susongensis]|uniref:Uncharacterized protein n=1 Tax=Paraburkholderia susongensis TaxID=1515439 RepID=A0A1X7LR37_9BURK|nr:hypothetical protein SAMN06265784_108123 [Paraburkholderia susongensis]
MPDNVATLRQRRHEALISARDEKRRTFLKRRGAA